MTTAHKLVQVEWLDGPGIFPSDIRSRHMRLHLPQSHQIPEQQIVWRSRFICNGSCRMKANSRPAKVLKSSNAELQLVAETLRQVAAKGRPYLAGPSTVSSSEEDSDTADQQHEALSVSEELEPIGSEREDSFAHGPIDSGMTSRRDRRHRCVQNAQCIVRRLVRRLTYSI
jgi:hypothetical protein